MPRFVVRQHNLDDWKEEAEAGRNAIDGVLAEIHREVESARLQTRRCLLITVLLVPVLLIGNWIEPGPWWIPGGALGGGALIGALDGWLAGDRVARLGFRAGAWVARNNFNVAIGEPDVAGWRHVKTSYRSLPVDELPDES